MYADVCNLAFAGGARQIKIEGQGLEIPSNITIKDYAGGGGMSIYPWVLFVVDSNHRSSGYLNDIFYYMRENGRGETKAVNCLQGNSPLIAEYVSTYKHALTS